MNRLHEIEDVLHELLEVAGTNLLHHPQLSDITDDVLRKLRLLLSYSQSSPSPNSSHLLTPATSSCSSVSEASEQFGEYEQAASAFERQIFSRCVQLVESAQQRGPIQLSMVTLAHNSYHAMVDEADDVDDATKFAGWWNQFLEKAESDRPKEERIIIFEYRMEALKRLFELAPNLRKSTSKTIISVATKSYRMVSHQRLFSSQSLRKLESLAQWIDYIARLDCGEATELEEVRQQIHQAIEDTENEAIRFKDKEEMEDADRALCVEILASLKFSQQAPSSPDGSNDSGFSDASLTRSRRSPLFKEAVEESIVVRL